MLLQEDIVFLLSFLYDSYVVGGYVRNKLIGQESNDVDITTSNLQTCLDILNLKNIKYYSKNTRYPVYCFKYSNYNIDISEFRTEICSGRHAVTKKTTNIYEDATRRDFTINCIYVDKNQNIYDPFSGQEDLKIRKVKFINNAYSRIKEDYLRILRYIRFCYFISKKPKIKKFLIFKQKINLISKERILEEIVKTIQYNIDFFTDINYQNLKLFKNFIYPLKVKNFDKKIIEYINVNKNYIYSRIKAKDIVYMILNHKRLKSKIHKKISTNSLNILKYLINNEFYIALCCLIKSKKIHFIKSFSTLIKQFKSEKDKIIKKEKNIKENISLLFQKYAKKF